MTNLTTFLNSLDAATLAKVLGELADDHEAVQERLERMQLASQPKQLAAAFKATLTGWRRSTRFIPYRESSAFGRELSHWLEIVERELVPVDAPGALALVELFMTSDEKFIGRADDSNGMIGDALREASQLWLRIAARCPPPAAGWMQRIHDLILSDGYSTREPLLEHANLLLDIAAMTALVTRFESGLAQAVVSEPGSRLTPVSAYTFSGALHSLSRALRDPDIHVRAVLQYSPEPNPMQREGFAREYIEYGRASDALPWLVGPWGYLELSRERLLADAYEQLGRRDECAMIRRGVFEQTLVITDFEAWTRVLSREQVGAAAEVARQCAHASDDPITAASLLIAIEDFGGAEEVLVALVAMIDGARYGSLVPMAEAMVTNEQWRGATACYRALLNAILARAYAKAYGHAAHYFKKLAEIAARAGDLTPLTSHADFEQEIRSRHARKVAFWSHVAGDRRA